MKLNIRRNIGVIERNHQKDALLPMSDEKITCTRGDDPTQEDLEMNQAHHSPDKEISLDPSKLTDVSKISFDSSISHAYGSNNKAVIRRLFETAKPDMKLILASAFIQGCTSCITLLFPYACGHVLDMSIIRASSETSNDRSLSPSSVALGLIGLTILAGLGVYTRSLLLNTAGNRIVSRIRCRVFASIVSQDASFFDTTKIGDLISRITNDSQRIESVVTTEIVLGIRGLIMTFVSTALLFYTSCRLAIVSLLSIPPVFVAAKIVGRALSEKQKEVQELHGEATHVADQVFSGIQTVQQFVTENHELRRYSKSINKAHGKEIQVGTTKAAFDAIVYVSSNIAVLLVLGYGGSLVASGHLSPGSLTGFLMYSLLMAGNLSHLSGTYAGMIKSIAAAGRVFEIIDRVPGITSSYSKFMIGETCTDKECVVASESKSIDQKLSSICFENVTFAYPTRINVPVLGPGFSLKVDGGENIAIVGGSGSGKSTISSLITRLYDCTEGRICFNEKNIKDFDIKYLRQHIGIVSQEPLLFDCSIADNIRYGRFNATAEEVIEAARAAHVLQFTDKMPHGLDTQVGGRGSQLSGGQKQRIAIARVILKDPPIVILDEATSALDAESEYHVHQAIHSVTKNRTVISIAHRISTIREANRILVLKDGLITEAGSFDNLLARKGVFHNLVKQQI